MSLVEVELPVEVETREEGLALLGYFIGRQVPEAEKPPWLRIAERMSAYLPWSKAKDLPRLFERGEGAPLEKPDRLRTNLYRERGAGTSVSVDLGVEEDGSIELSGQDLGEAPKVAFGSDSYEYWVRLKPPALRHLVFALLSTRFSASANAVSEFRDFCKSHQIEHEFGTWPL